MLTLFPTRQPSRCQGMDALESAWDTLGTKGCYSFQALLPILSPSCLPMASSIHRQSSQFHPLHLSLLSNISAALPGLASSQELCLQQYEGEDFGIWPNSLFFLQRRSKWLRMMHAAWRALSILHRALQDDDCAPEKKGITVWKPQNEWSHSHTG